MSAAAFAQEPPQTNYEIDKLEGHEVQRYPTFRGGNANKFSHWVTAHLVYPRDAKKKCIQGTVKVNFVVDVDGRVKDVEVVEGVCESLDAEADIRRLTETVMASIEAQIRADPGEWFWYNRRWVLDPLVN